jgi:tetratricopeptide (TPR) repeat protein
MHTMATTGDDRDKRSSGGKRHTGRPAASIIHVNFRSGARVQPPPDAPGTARAAVDPSGSREPLTDVFSTREVIRLLGLTTGRLRALDRASIVRPSGSRNGRRAYTFQDLIALRATHDLLASRVKVRDVAEAILALKKTLPRVTRPLQQLRIVSDGRRVVVRGTEGPFEPTTGQLVLDFQVNALRDDVVRVLRPESSAGHRTAYELYMKASALDEDPATYDEAEELYTKALHHDPSLAIAYTNLGNVLFRRGEEERALGLYQRALAIDPDQPEAHYNIGYVALERGEGPTAVVHFERAVRSDARFADAHFNLAMALEQAGEADRAQQHWRRYLDLEPTGTWADVAQQHLR